MQRRCPHRARVSLLVDALLARFWRQTPSVVQNGAAGAETAFSRYVHTGRLVPPGNRPVAWQRLYANAVVHAAGPARVILHGAGTLHCCKTGVLS